MAISNGNLTPEILGAFTELYEFYDGVKYSRYTSFNEPITFESNDYKPVNITRYNMSQEHQEKLMAECNNEKNWLDRNSIQSTKDEPSSGS